MSRRSIERTTGVGLAMAVAVVSGHLVLQTTAVAQDAGRQLFEDAAAAMGGHDRIMAVKTLVFEGAGHDFQVDQEYSYDEIGSQFLVYQLRDYKRAYDLANGRGRFEQVREAQATIFNGERPQRTVQALDGDIAFTIGENGNATRVFQANAQRVEYLRHPLTLVRAGLAPTVTLGYVRTQGTERLVDLKIGAIVLTVAFDATTKLPARVVHLVDSATLGDRPNEMRWSDYRSVSGVQLPTLFTWKVGRWTVGQIRVVRQSVDGDVGNLAAPPAVVSATRPAPPPPPTSVVREIAKGIWEHSGTTHKSYLVELSDRLVLVDAPNVERTLAVMTRAKELRPDKPVRTLILGHNHGDHTGGIRTAVAMGINEIITHRSNLALLDETFKNPHTLDPDLYSKTPNAKPPEITAIDDEGVLKDPMNTINFYHRLDSSHSGSQLLIYYANARMVTLADVYMPNDPRVMIPGEPFGHQPWIQNVLANLRYRKLQVDTMAPVHGDVEPFSRFMEEAITLTAKPMVPVAPNH
jgi:glyoxylase-like metal-dependent hydrolase (beta-lactamase superfamily II)